MTISPHHSLVLSAIKDSSPERLQKAVCGLADGSLTVTPTRLTEVDIRALVRNGDGAEYGVTLTEALTTCSCKDALYRGVICKHAVAVALHVLRTPEPQKEEEAKPQVISPTISHLMWRDGLVVCGEPDPYTKHAKVWQWPWSDHMLTWPEACPDCVKIYHSGYHRHMAMKEAA